MNQCGCVTMPFLDSHHRDGIVGQQLLKIFVAIDRCRGCQYEIHFGLSTLINCWMLLLTHQVIKNVA